MSGNENCVCVCSAGATVFYLRKRVCISDERKNAQPYRASGLGISRSSFLCLPLRLSTRRRKMKQLELRRQMSHLFEHDQLFCLNEKQIKLKGQEMESKDGRNPTPMERFHGF